MKTIESVAELKQWRTDRKNVGFVPTMGALHEGHLQLIKQSCEENDDVVVSIFVNPTQFDDPKDLEAYPQKLKEDVYKIQDIADVLFLPTADELYPSGYRFRVEEQEYSKILEGRQRPGHFAGMLTVVLKLLNIVTPDNSYFGEKDFQQLKLVEKMSEDLFLSTNIIGCPTVREIDGLAMSSRNSRLTAEERALAPQLYRELNRDLTTTEIKQNLEKLGFQVEYVDEWKGRRLVAARLGSVRLIDNVSTSIA